MKKTISFISALTLAMSAIGGIQTLAADTAEKSPVTASVISTDTKGDANGDMELTIADAVSLQNWLMGKANTIITDTSALDLCADGRIDVFDFIKLKEMIVELIADIPLDIIPGTNGEWIDDIWTAYEEGVNGEWVELETGSFEWHWYNEEEKIPGYNGEWIDNIWTAYEEGVNGEWVELENGSFEWQWYEYLNPGINGEWINGIWKAYKEGVNGEWVEIEDGIYNWQWYK